MGKYYKLGENKELIEISFSEVLANGIIKLIESGIDEDAHFRSGWENIKTDDLKEYLGELIKTPKKLDEVICYLREDLICVLSQIVEDFERENKF